MNFNFRLKILQYFEGENVTCTPRLNCCDNCRRGSIATDITNIYKNLDENGLYDFTADARLLVEALKLFNGWSGYSKPISLLRGSHSQAIKKYHGHPLHGRGKFKSEDFWQALADQLERLSFFEKVSLRNVQQKAFGHTIKLTQKAEIWLNANETLALKPTDQMLKFLPKKHASPEKSTKLLQSIPIMAKATTTDLKNSLLLVRIALASQYDTKPYVIASNLALEQIADKQPLSLDDMRAAKIDGFSEAKIIKFGQKFITAILKWKRFLAADTNDGDDCDSMESHLQLNQYPDNRVTVTHERVRYLLAQNKSVEQIAVELSIKNSTVINYISILIKAGVPYKKCDIRTFIKLSEDEMKHIEEKLPKDLTEMMSVRLSTIKQNCDENIEYDQIKLVLAYYQVRAYLMQQNLRFHDPDVVISGEEQSTKMEVETESSVNIVQWDDDDSCFGSIEEKELETTTAPSTIAEPMSIGDTPTESSKESTNKPVDVKPSIDSMFDKDGDDALSEFNLIEVKVNEKHPLAMDVEHDDDLPTVVAKKEQENLSNKLNYSKYVAKSNPNKRVMYDNDDEDAKKSDDNHDDDPVKKSSPKAPRSQMPQWVHDSVQRAKIKTNVTKKKNLF